MKKLFLIAILPIIGCNTQSIEITTTKSWEGHYYTEEQIKNSVANIKLDKKESVWIMSNKTLETILNNIRKEK